MAINKEENFISAVVYLHDDEQYIESFLTRLYSLLDANFLNHEIICVDDGSTDGTINLIHHIAAGFASGTLSIIKLNNCQGYESAMNAGVEMAIGDYVLEFDSCIVDYDIELILKAYEKTSEGFDIVSTSNNVYRKKSSRAFYKVFNNNANLQYNIQSESFRIVSRRAINKIYSMSKSIKYRKAFYANCGLRFTCIHYDGSRELALLKKRYKQQRVDTAATSLILFTNVAYKISLGISFFMMLATVIMAIYAVVTFITNHAVVGFTTTMLVITGSFLAVFVIFAIILKYLSVIIQMIFNKQDYRIESIEKISR